MPDYQHLETSTDGKVTVLRFVDSNLTSNTVVNEVDVELEKFVQERKPAMLLVSFANVQRSSTAVINSLLRTLRRLDKLGCRLKLCDMHENLRREFEMMQLDGSVFEIHDTHALAMAAFIDNPDDRFRHFKVQKRGPVYVIHLLDQRIFDNLTLSELDEELEQFVTARQPDKLLVNFGPVSRCSTAVINSLLRTRSRLLAANGQIKLCGMNEHIRGEFNMLALEGTVFEIYDSATEAFARFR